MNEGSGRSDAAVTFTGCLQRCAEITGAVSPRVTDAEGCAKFRGLMQGDRSIDSVPNVLRRRAGSLFAGQRGSRVVSSSFVGLWTTTPGTGKSIALWPCLKSLNPSRSCR